MPSNIMQISTDAAAAVGADAASRPLTDSEIDWVSGGTSSAYAVALAMATGTSTSTSTLTETAAVNLGAASFAYAFAYARAVASGPGASVAGFTGAWATAL